MRKTYSVNELAARFLKKLANLSEDSEPEDAFWYSVPETEYESDRDEQYLDKLKAAKNPNCPHHTLDLLATDPDINIRAAVASNPNCPPQILHLLANDSEDGVRNQVAHNYNCPVAVIRLLADDSNIRVRFHAACNRNCPLDVKEMIRNEINARRG